MAKLYVQDIITMGKSTILGSRVARKIQGDDKSMLTPDSLRQAAHQWKKENTRFFPHSPVCCNKQPTASSPRTSLRGTAWSSSTVYPSLAPPSLTYCRCTACRFSSPPPPRTRTAPSPSSAPRTTARCSSRTVRPSPPYTRPRSTTPHTPPPPPPASGTATDRG